MARSVMESGRTRVTKIYRDIVKRSDRREANQKVKNLVSHGSDDEDLIFDDDMNKDFSWGNPKLSPVRSFLRSKVGEKWSDVFSELTSKTGELSYNALRDIKNSLLNHVLESPSGLDHHGRNPYEILKSYTGSLDNNRAILFYVDEDGLIQDVKEGIDYYKVTEEDLKMAALFLDNRAVAVNGNKLHWAYPREGIYKIDYLPPTNEPASYHTKHLKLTVMREEYGPFTKHHERTVYGYINRYKSEETGAHFKEIAEIENFVARSELSTEDYENFEKFPEKVKKMILEIGKGITV